MPEPSALLPTNSSSIERWVPIPGYDGWYEVSSVGDVRSVDRITTNKLGRTIRWRARPLRQFLDRKGYPAVRLQGSARLVHQLVMKAFVGPRPAGMQIRHLNGDKADARLVNLAYGTASENQRDRVAHGDDPNRNKTHCPQGHPYSGDNLVAIRDGRWRRCRQCKRVQDRATWHRRTARRRSIRV